MLAFKENKGHHRMKKTNLKKLAQSDSESFEELTNEMKNAFYHIASISSYFNEDRADVFSASEKSILENMAKRLNKMIDDVVAVDDETYLKRRGYEPWQ